MAPGFQFSGGPAVEYLLKEVSFSTCDNRFFGELEKEMLIPNNVNIHGRLKGAANLKDHTLNLEFPEETVIGYIKKPLSNTIQGSKRVLTYRLDDLVNFDDYWWFPLKEETEFYLGLNLLPPFPSLNPLDLQITCRPDVAVGLESHVTTTIGLEAEEQIDNLFVKVGVPPQSLPGTSLSITQFSGDNISEPRQSVTSPSKGYPFPKLSLKKGESLEYKATVRISSDPSRMSFLRCQQDIASMRLLALSHSTPDAAPCSVAIIDGNGREIPVLNAIRSTILHANAQVMYSPFSVRKEAGQKAIIQATA